jgi:tetratricopeptide (TPR) repeat protein
MMAVYPEQKPIGNHEKTQGGLLVGGGVAMIVIYWVLVVFFPQVNPSAGFMFAVFGVFFVILGVVVLGMTGWQAYLDREAAKVPLQEHLGEKAMLEDARLRFRFGMKLLEEIRQLRDQMSVARGTFGLEWKISGLKRQMQQEFRHVIARCDQLLGKQSKPPEVLALKGRSLFYLKEYRQALPLLLDILHHEEDEEDLYRVGMSYYSVKNYPSALQYLGELVERNSWHEMGLWMQYKIGKALKDYHLTYAAINKLVALNPKESKYTNAKSKLVGWEMTDADVVDFFYPQCPQCHSTKGFVLVGSVFRNAVCNKCGVKIRVSLWKLRSQLKKTPHISDLTQKSIAIKSRKSRVSIPKSKKPRSVRLRGIKVDHRKVTDQVVRVACQLCDVVSYSERAFFECTACGRQTCVTCQGQFKNYRCQQCGTQMVKVVYDA